MALANDKIEAIRERADIVQVIGAYIALKKHGQRFVGLCPFHNEKTPSFSVSSDKGLFYCFGCHAGGDVFAFVMKREGLDFNAAARRLGQQVGVELEPETEAMAKARQVDESLVRTNNYALAFFQHSLAESSGVQARKYLGDRGLAPPLLDEWRLGYGGTTADIFAYLDSKRVPRELVSQAGLLSEDGQRLLFEGRVVFPVCDAIGRLCGFGGRRIGAGNSPKYLNTRDSPIFSKRRLLFGWEHAENTIRLMSRVVIVEGYMDVIASHTAGVTQTVAALGTAFSPEHARQCSRLAKEAVLLFDGDTPGRAASFKAAEQLLAAKLTTKVAVLPVGFDPDSYWRKNGAQALAQLVERAESAIEYFMNISFAKAATVEAKAAAAREVWPLILALGQGLERDLYTSRLSERMGMPVQQLTMHMHKQVISRRASGQEQTGRNIQNNIEQKASEKSGEHVASTASIDHRELAILRDLVLYPELRPKLGTLVEYAQESITRQILEELATTDDDLVIICTRHSNGDKRILRLGQVRPVTPTEDMADRAARTFDDVLRRMKARHVDAALHDVLRELGEVEARGEDPSELIRRQQDLSRRKKALLCDRRQRDRR